MCATIEAMIGLHRTQIQLAEANDSWANAFSTEKSRIQRVLVHIDPTVEHIGSTAVPGLLAKPIIDLGILLTRPEDISTVENLLVFIGYIYRGDKGSMGGHLFVLEKEPEVRTYHVHVIIQGDLAWDRYIRFRDLLRNSAGLRQQYALLKQNLAQQLNNDRSAYMAAKTHFIADALATE